MEFTPELAYLLGLITGRGTFYASKKRIIIEFNYAKQLESIPFCPKCGKIMTGNTCGTDGKQEPQYTIGPFDQQSEIESEIDKTIIPILQKITENTPETSHAFTNNGGDTYLSLSFQNEPEKFEKMTLGGLLNS